MDEAQRQSQPKNDRREEEQFPQAGSQVAPFQMEIEASSSQLPDRQKPIEANIYQEQFIQGSQAGGPCAVEPAQINGQPEDQKNEGVAPVSALLGIRSGGMHQQPRGRHRQHEVK